MSLLKLIAELGLDVGPFKKGLDDAGSHSKRAAQTIGGEFKAMFGHFLTAAAGLEFLHKISEDVDQIADSSKRLGITTDEFQKMGIAARRAGQDIGSRRGIGKVFNDLAELRAKAEGGDLKAMETLHSLGVSMLGAADSSETLYQAFEKVINQSDTKLAEVFGGRVLLDVKAFRAQMLEVGNAVIYTADQIRELKKANEEWANVSRVTKVVGARAITSKLEFLSPGKSIPERFKALADIFDPSGFLSGLLPSKKVQGPPLELASGVTGNNRKLLLDAQRRVKEQLAYAQQQLLGAEGGGANYSGITSQLVGRFGGARGLIGTAGIQGRDRVINPELKKHLEELKTQLKDIEDELRGKSVIF